jgi:hypothetical protein
LDFLLGLRVGQEVGVSFHVVAALGEVVDECVVVEGGVLWDNAQVLAQRLLRALSDVLPVDEYLALVELVEALQQAHDGGLARTSCAHECAGLAFFHAE